MTLKSLTKLGRLATLIVAAGVAFAPVASAQTQLPPPTGYGQADARQDRIEELEAQLRDATAENERLQYQLMEANRETTRLRGMVGELAAVNQSAVENAQSGMTGGASGATPPAQNGNAVVEPDKPPETGVLGTLEAGPAYARARDLLVNGNYAEAEAAFAEYLRTFPDVENAPEARYWYAFTLLARNNHTEAASNFVNYLQHTPNGRYGPEAQVRLGMALAGMGEQRQACGAFASLTRRYPQAPAAVRALAARESRAANCPA